MTVTFRHGTTARFYWHARDWSPYVESVELGMTRSMAEHRPLSGTAVVRVPGYNDAKITLAGAPFEKLTTDLTAYTRFHENYNRPWAFMPDGDVVGRIAYCGLSRADSMGAVAGDDIVRLPVGLVTSSEYDRGVVLHTLGSAATSPGSSVNGGGATTGGLVAYMLCSSITGGQTLAITVENSANNSDWLEVGAGELTQDVTAASSTMSFASGTILQYLRVSWTLTGGSATWFLAVARR